MAARHAIIYFEAGRVMVADNGGGLVLNGASVASSAVTGADDLRVGGFRLKVERLQASVSFRPAAQMSPSTPLPVPSAVPGPSGFSSPPDSPRGRTPTAVRARGPLEVPPPPAPPPPPPNDLVLEARPSSEPVDPSMVESALRMGGSLAPLDLDDEETTRQVPRPPAEALRGDRGASVLGGAPRARPIPPPISDLEPTLGGKRGAEGAAPATPGPKGLSWPSEVASRAAPPPPPPAPAPVPETAVIPRPTAASLGPRAEAAQAARGVVPGPFEGEPTPVVPVPMGARPLRDTKADAEAAAREAAARESAAREAAARESAARESAARESAAPIPSPSPALLAPWWTSGVDDGDDDDDHDDDDRHFMQPFSLLDNVVRERFTTPIKAENEAVLEVLRYRDGRLFEAERVARGGAFAFWDARIEDPFELVQLRRNGRARLFFHPGLRGNVVVAGETVPLTALCDEKHQADKKGSLFAVDVGEGDYAHVRTSDTEGYLLRFVRAPLGPPVSYTMRLAREDKVYLGSATFGMMLVLVAIWVQALISPPETFAMEEEVEFAEVSLKELELEKPEPTPTPEPTPEPPAPPAEAPPPPAPEPPKKQPRERPRARSRANTPPSNDPPPPSAPDEAASALAALDNIVPAGPKSLTQAVSNIAAVRVPSGTAKRFQVSGPVGKAVGGEVMIGVGSPGGRDTKAATALLEGKNVAELKGGASGGRVRATVGVISTKRVVAEGGFLSREEIAKVVNGGAAELQRCYERELLRSPGLEGTITMEWIIGPSGDVTSTRLKGSTLRSEEVASCVSGVVKGWKFPKPTGGSVTVTYPFQFRGSAF